MKECCSLIRWWISFFGKSSKKGLSSERYHKKKKKIVIGLILISKSMIRCDKIHQEKEYVDRVLTPRSSVELLRSIFFSIRSYIWTEAAQSFISKIFDLT